MNRSLRSCLVAICLVAFASDAPAAAPADGAAFGIEIGATPESVAQALARRYRDCSVVKSVYHALPGDDARPIAALGINPDLVYDDIGAIDVCSYSPAGNGIVDAIDARFVHPSIDSRQIAYSIEARRVFPDAAHSPTRRVQRTFEAVRAELLRTYGRPVDERRERTVSAAANRAKSLGIRENGKREDFLVRYLWSERGRLPDVERQGATCNCAGRYVKAVIEISRSPTTIPKNMFYVLSVALFVEDADLRARQDAWNAQWGRTRQ